MILVDGNVQLEHGSDYDGHYILKNGSEPEQIIGIIDLKKRKTKSEDNIIYLAEKILRMLKSYYSSK